MGAVCPTMVERHSSGGELHGRQEAYVNDNCDVYDVHHFDEACYNVTHWSVDVTCWTLELGSSSRRLGRGFLVRHRFSTRVVFPIWPCNPWVCAWHHS